MKMTLRTGAQATVFALVLMVVAIGVRFLATDLTDEADLAWFRGATQMDVGPSEAWFASGLNGDGATFVIMAGDPLGRGPGQLLRYPAYRYSRVGYSWLAAAVVAGREGLLLLGLSAVGLASFGVVGWIAFRLEERRGIAAWLLLLNPALLVGFIWDTAESLAVVLLSLALWRGSAWATASVVLVRPSYILALGSRTSHLLLGALGAVLIKGIWSVRFQESFFSGAWNLTFPIKGFLDTPSAVGLLVLLAGAATMVIGLFRRDLGWALSGLLVVSMGAVVYDTPINALRAAGMLPVLWAFGPGYQGQPKDSDSSLVGGDFYPEEGVRPPTPL